MIDRRRLLASGIALAAASAGTAAHGRPARHIAAGPIRQSGRAFPPGFLWGAATAGHQVEGNNSNSDCWVLENVKPTVYREPSGDACNSFELWNVDLDLVSSLGLNSYRFSLEWARIEPEEGQFSVAMLDHYRRIIEGCRARGLAPVVTFNHYTAPRWFAADGGWTNPKSALRFARYCERAARHLAAGMAMAMTLNEPNIMAVLRVVLPPPVFELQHRMLQAAARATGSAKFSVANAIEPDDIDLATSNMVAGHKAGSAAIKTVRPDLPVGFSLSMFDDIAVGKNSLRDAMRQKLYAPWLEVAQGDDYMGVQNYERQLWTATGRLPPEHPVPGSTLGANVEPSSLGAAVRYAHSVTGRPVLVSEHGINTTDDTMRAALIPAALAGLKQAMDGGVPVLGYIHWSLLDNFEWISGYEGRLGLFTVDRQTFARTAKPSASVLAAIARRNALS